MSIRAEITDVIRLDVFLDMFENFHEHMTGNRLYADDEWMNFRTQVILKAHVGIAEERKIDPTKMVLD